MNQDIQVVRKQSLPAVPDDPWLQPAAETAVSQQTPLDKVHRSLRGRYTLAAVLAVIGAVAGGLIGFYSQKPLYRSTGLIEIRPTPPRLDLREQVIPMYDAQVRTQAGLIQDPRIMNAAMQSDEWRALGRRFTLDAQRRFANSLRVEHWAGTSFIRVSFLDVEPEAARIAVDAVLDVYMERHGKGVADEVRRKRTLHQEAHRVQSTELEDLWRRYNNIASGRGIDELSSTLAAQLSNEARLEAQLRDVRLTREATEAALRNFTDEQRANLTPEQLASVDPTMSEYLRRRERMEGELLSLSRTYGPSHRLLVHARANMEDLDEQIGQHIDVLRSTYLGFQPNPQGTGTMAITPVYVEHLRSNEQKLQALLDEQQLRTRTLGRDVSRLRQLAREIQQAQAQVDRTQQLLDQLDQEIKAAQELSGRIEKHAAYTPPVPSVDRRKQMAVLGTFGGAAFPVGLLLLIGLLDHRYRYSDETKSGMSGIPLLGILPNLPDRLTDPEQAAIAAHCVHQIRTRLQIPDPNQRHPRRAFAITSAAPGDGKTSLSLALGLSFAASGSRTLLIDCDVIGGGLTSRLNVSSPDGVLEAIANNSLLEYVRTTDVEELSVLPVGSAHIHHASMLSPAGLCRLAEEARKHFDTVIIDTGPILGSIEAGPVCVAVDGVILTVARGQQRPSVEKSLSHLLAIGSPVAGVVFNRAQPRDFAQSVSRFSVRSIPAVNGNGRGPGAGPGQPSTQFGPVARAVASSTKPIEEHEQG